MKEKVTIARLMEVSKGDKKQLNLLFKLIQNHKYFQGERKRLYKLIVKHKKV